MKTLLSLLTLASPLLSAWAFGADLPADFCGGFNCSAAQQSIQQEFRSARGLDAASLPIVASGACYLVGKNYDASYKQYGYVLLDPKDGQVYMDGTFGFFYPENPYASVTLDQARKSAGDNFYAAGHLLTQSATYAYIDFAPNNPPENKFEYWLAQANSNEVVLMANWGIGHKLFCRLERNP